MTVTADQREVIHHVEANIDAAFTWDYDRSRDSLVRLYEKAKTSQWNVTTDLPWETDVDPEKIAAEAGARSGTLVSTQSRSAVTPAAATGGPHRAGRAAIRRAPMLRSRAAPRRPPARP